MANTDKIRETRIRNTAKRRGLVLSRTRRRDPKALDYGTYSLYRPTTSTTTDTSSAWVTQSSWDTLLKQATLDEVEQYLDGQK